MFVVCGLQAGEETVAGFAEEFVRSGIEVRTCKDVRVVLAETQAVGRGKAVGDLRHGELGGGVRCREKSGGILDGHADDIHVVICGAAFLCVRRGHAEIELAGGRGFRLQFEINQFDNIVFALDRLERLQRFVFLEAVNHKADGIRCGDGQGQLRPGVRVNPYDIARISGADEVDVVVMTDIFIPGENAVETKLVSGMQRQGVFILHDNFIDLLGFAVEVVRTGVAIHIKHAVRIQVHVVVCFLALLRIRGLHRDEVHALFEYDLFAQNSIGLFCLDADRQFAVGDRHFSAAVHFVDDEFCRAASCLGNVETEFRRALQLDLAEVHGVAEANVIREAIMFHYSLLVMALFPSSRKVSSISSGVA